MGGSIDNSSSQRIPSDSMIESASSKQGNAELLKIGMNIGMNSKVTEEKGIRQIKSRSDEAGETDVSGGGVLAPIANALNKGLYAVTALHIAKQFHSVPKLKSE